MLDVYGLNSNEINNERKERHDNAISQSIHARNVRLRDSKFTRLATRGKMSGRMSPLDLLVINTY